jgi:hypothetical protein
MSITDISFSSEISYHHSSQFVFYSIMLFYSLIEVGFHCIPVFFAIFLFVSHFFLNIIQIINIPRKIELVSIGMKLSTIKDKVSLEII